MTALPVRRANGTNRPACSEGRSSPAPVSVTSQRPPSIGTSVAVFPGTGRRAAKGPGTGPVNAERVVSTGTSMPNGARKIRVAETIPESETSSCTVGSPSAASRSWVVECRPVASTTRSASRR